MSFKQVINPHMKNNDVSDTNANVCFSVPLDSFKLLLSDIIGELAIYTPYKSYYACSQYRYNIGYLSSLAVYTS